MAYGQNPGRNNTNTNMNAPPVRGPKGSGKPVPIPLRKPAKNPMLLLGGLGLLGGFVFLKMRAVFNKSEDAKARTTYNKDDQAGQSDKMKGKSYHVTVERSGGGI